MAVAVFLLIVGLTLGMWAGSDASVSTGAARRRTSGRNGISSLLPAIFVAVTGGGTWLVTGRPMLALAAFAGGYVLASLLIRRKRARGDALESTYGVECIQMAVRVLRAGVPVHGLIETLGRDARGESGEAFREVRRREQLGESLEMAIREVLIESSRPELRSLGMALLLQLEVGGDLAVACDRLGGAILERRRTERRGQAIVMYGRVGGAVLAIAPFVVVPVLSASIDGYSQFLLETPAGQTLIGVSMLLLVLGTTSLGRMLRVEAMPTGAVG